MFFSYLPAPSLLDFPTKHAAHGRSATAPLGFGQSLFFLLLPAKTKSICFLGTTARLSSSYWIGSLQFIISACSRSNSSVPQRPLPFLLYFFAQDIVVAFPFICMCPFMIHPCYKSPCLMLRGSSTVGGTRGCLNN